MKTTPLALALLTALTMAACQPGAPTTPSSATPSLPPLIDSLPSASPTPAEPAPDVPLEGKFLFYEDFEKGAERWSISGGANGVGWARLNAYTCGGAWTMLLGKGEQEAFSQVAGESVLTLKTPIDLKGAERPHLVFDVRGETTPAEAVSVQAEVSRDGTAWAPVGEPAKGRYRFVSTRFADMTAYRGQSVRLRFVARFAAGETPIKGLLFDDVRVIEPDRSRQK